ncbi:IclR family transcriptional regulator [Consotaella aegiceratis]|uniref:IclR family transcriptional regulator n=1 Tax=Consotaella aegiceratis TaxID=3097961 RepID=UPI002F3E9E2E
MTGGKIVPPNGVLERALWLMSQFSMSRRRLHLRELAALSGLDKATAYRALKVLVEWNYLERGTDGSYSPGPANLRLASLFKATSNFIARLEGPIAAISRRVNQTAAFFVRSNEERICLVRDHAFQDFRYFIEVGGSVALDEGGAAAQLLLAFTDEDNDRRAKTRADGYYISRGERNKHFASVAVPLFESDGLFLGAVTITGMGVDLADEDLIGFIDVVRQEVAAAGFSACFPQ